MKMDGKAILQDFIDKISDNEEVMMKEQIWNNKLKEMTPFQYSFSEDPQKDRYFFQGDFEVEDKEKLFNDIILSLSELPVYQNHNLLNSSLVMLRGIFEQRKDLLKNFK